MRRILVIAVLLAGAAGHAQTYTDVWNDVGGRSNYELDSALNIDSTACEREAGAQEGRPSAIYIKCMRAHRWTYSHLIRNRARYSPGSAAEAEASRTSQQNADDSSRQVDDVVRHDDEMNSANDAANAAAAAAVSSGN